MAKHHDNEKSIPESQKLNVLLEALRDERWDYRTVDGLSDQTGLNPSVIKSILGSSNLVNKSFMSSENEPFYSLKKENKFDHLIDAWKKLRFLSSKKMGD